MHVIVRSGTSIVRLGDGVLHEPHRRLLQMRERLSKRLQIDIHVVTAGTLLEIGLDLIEESHDGTAAILAELAADEVERLYAVGSLVNLRNASIAHELLHPVLGDVPVTPKNLLRQHCIGEPAVSEDTFDHGGQEA